MVGAFVRPPLRPACAALGSLVLAATVSAQTQSTPTLPEPPPEAAPASTDDEAATDGGGPSLSRPAQWAYNLGVGAGYDSNINYRLVEGPSSVTVSPRGGFTRIFTGPRGELTVGASGRYFGYADAKDLNRWYANGLVSGVHRPSPSTTWRATAGYGMGYSDSAAILTDQGVVLPLVGTQSTTATLGVNRSLGHRSALRVTGRFNYVHFDPQDAAALDLVDGQSLRGTAGYRHGVGARDALGVEYSIEAALSRQQPQPGQSRTYYQSHYGSVQWNHVVSQKSAFVLEAGASYTPQAVEAGLGRRQSFYGGAGYTLQSRRSSLTISARREVIPAFGLGVSRIVNRAGVDLTQSLGRFWVLHLDGTYVLPETPKGLTEIYGPRYDLFAGLGRRLGHHFDIAAEGRYRNRGSTTGDIPNIQAYQVGLFLTVFGPRGASHLFGR